MKLGSSDGRIFLRYESGDTVQSIIFGQAVECKVWIRKPEIRVEDTYLDLARKTTVEIINDSEYLLKYRWVRNRDLQEDQEQKEKSETFHNFYWVYLTILLGIGTKKNWITPRTCHPTRTHSFQAFSTSSIRDSTRTGARPLKPRT